MTEPLSRRSWTNIFVKPSFQIKLIVKILFVMIMTGAVTTLIVAWIYHVKSQTGSFYYMSNDIRHDIELTSILGFILPALLAAQAVSFIVAFFIGMFTSRKAAVPAYKIEKWAAQLRAGNLNTRLAFREHDEMYELTRHCNAAVEYYKQTFAEIRQSAAVAASDPGDQKKVKIGLEGIGKALGKVTFD